MRYYFAIVHQEDNSAFGVQFPDVPGCFSAADTMDELLPNASEALGLFFEDQDALEARTLEQIRSDSGVEKKLAEGAFLLAVPLIDMSGRSVKANISIDSGLLAAIDTTAKQRGLTRSSFLAQLARREISGS